MWPLFSTPVAFELLWFRNRATYLKAKTCIGSIDGWSEYYLVQFGLRNSDFHPEIPEEGAGPLKIVELNRAYYPPIEQPICQTYIRGWMLCWACKIHSDILSIHPPILYGQNCELFSSSVAFESPWFRNGATHWEFTTSWERRVYVISKFGTPPNSEN